MFDTTTLQIDGYPYIIQQLHHKAEAVEAPRVVIVAYQPTQQAQALLRTCLDSIRSNTPQPHEVWVIDNNSPLAHTTWLYERDDINVVLNRTEPIPPEKRKWYAQILGRLTKHYNQRTWGSYANAIGLEIAVRLIEPQSRYLMTLHMDTMVCHPNWLAFLQSKLVGNIAAAGMRLDHGRTSEGVLHVLGYLVDFQIFRRLKLNFFPALPKFDVGDRVTVELRKAGYTVFSCRNAFTDPEVEELFPASSPLKQLSIDRVFDDVGNLIFLHLGRGVRKSSGDPSRGLSIEEWVRLADETLLVGIQQTT
jgi:hypothetical protein